MSAISVGSVYSQTPLAEADLVEIDRALAERAERLTRTRKGRVWEYVSDGVSLDVRVDDLERVLWDSEDDLVSLGLQQEPGRYRVSFIASHCGADANREIDRLCAAVASAIGGVSTGSQQCH
jgi:hypothetical protein